MEYRRLSELESNDILKTATLEEVPDGYREEGWVEEDNGGVIDNWFVGSEGAVSWNGGETLTNERFQLLVTHDGG